MGGFFMCNAGCEKPALKRLPMTDPLLIAKNDSAQCWLMPQLANRHGLITGATGSG